MNSRLAFPALLTSLSLLTACSPDSEPPAPVETVAEAAPAAAEPAATPESTTGKATLGEWGVETQYMDESVDPGDDFYRYVNNGWVETAELPTGFSRLSSFTQVALDTEEQLEAILADILAQDWPAGTTEHNAKAFYESYMDIERRNALGVEPLRAELDAIAALSSHEAVAKFMAGEMSPAFPNIGVTLDDGNPERYVLQASQYDGDLPREFLASGNETYAPYMTAYEQYLATLLAQAGIDRPAERAAETLALEIRLAEAAWTPTETRDKVRRYHLMSMEEFYDYASGLDWQARLEAGGFGGRDDIVVAMDTAVQAQSQIFADTPVPVLQSWLIAQLIDGNADMLSAELEDTHFAFYSGTLAGIDEPRPREKRALQNLNVILGEPIGKLYVERYFPESSKTELERMIGYLQTALHARMEASEWMDDATRAEAIDKLNNFAVHVGYPERWQDFSSLAFEPGDLVGNIRQFIHWQTMDGIAKLDMPNQRWIWLTNPQVINAFYAGVFNSITFPAAVLQPPFFDPNADPAVNFGAIGAAIGHEIGHGFDDQGSQSDGKGVLRNWWTPEARAEFDARADQLVAQYDQYSPIEGVQVNGRLTLGENIGDMSGLNVSYAAWKAYEQEHYGGEAPVLDGFTGDQRFFLSYAQLWRNIATDQTIQKLALTDNHSPGVFRANGIVRNFDPWYEAFDVTEDDALYLPPEARVSIW